MGEKRGCGGVEVVVDRMAGKRVLGSSMGGLEEWSGMGCRK